MQGLPDSFKLKFAPANDFSRGEIRGDPSMTGDVLHLSLKVRP